jgi:hypothetical protein
MMPLGKRNNTPTGYCPQVHAQGCGKAQTCFLRPWNNSTVLFVWAAILWILLLLPVSGRSSNIGLRPPPPPPSQQQPPQPPLLKRSKMHFNDGNGFGLEDRQMKEGTRRTLIGWRRLGTGTCATLTKGAFLNVVTASCTLGVTTTVNSNEVLLVKGSGNHPELNRDGAANGETSVYARHFVVDGTGKLTLMNLKLSGAWVGKTDAGCYKGICGYCRKTSCGCTDCCENCGAQTACSLVCGNDQGNDHKGGALLIKSRASVTTLVDVVFGTNIAFTSSTSHNPTAWTSHFSTGNIYSHNDATRLYLSHMSTPDRKSVV